MATIEDLNKSISLMENDEALSLVLKCRNSRRVRKVVKQKGKTTSASKPEPVKKKVDVMDLFKQLSLEQKLEFLKEMEDKVHE